MNTTTRTARDRAMSTPEILEMILLQLDLRTLLIAAQRVCRSWVTLISQSVQIQRALFFSPVDKPDIPMHEKTQNPLLAETFPCVFPSSGKELGKCKFAALDMNQSSTKRAMYMRKEASWRRMLVQQPPILDFGLLRVVHGQVGDQASAFKIHGSKDMLWEKHEGLRMERLFEVLLFNECITWEEWSTNKVMWATEFPLDIQECDDIANTFDSMMRKFGLVIKARTVMQCSIGFRSKTEDEHLRGQLVAAYIEAGLDIDQSSISCVKMNSLV
ncbi:hypothetical protein N7474_000865 [Penicillium riverlandense]|uniref:uncharacterized protein n=1 Tax=Penicillium riverlandense TaxID=1903569 RepID=UPI0025495CDD|nr:uncharacterized protein N7474_000865 [Penicillium riverlandense]KAJ5832554.1 hypothetical protein N7474_000865 [Penicillium riverlandense]